MFHHESLIHNIQTSNIFWPSIFLPLDIWSFIFIRGRVPKEMFYFPLNLINNILRQRQKGHTIERKGLECRIDQN